MFMVCTEEDFRPVSGQVVRWLDRDGDYPLAADFWRKTNAPLAQDAWVEANDQYGYRYAAVVLDGKITSVAALLPFSTQAWDVSAVKTDPVWRRQGYGKAVVSFVTDAIVSAGRTATCSTGHENVPMIKTAHSVGFHAVAEPEEAPMRDAQHDHFERVRVRIRAG